MRPIVYIGATRRYSLRKAGYAGEEADYQLCLFELDLAGRNAPFKLQTII